MRAFTSATAQGYMKKSLEIPRDMSEYDEEVCGEGSDPMLILMVGNTVTTESEHRLEHQKTGNCQ